jgi:hypothetical protein
MTMFGLGFSVCVLLILEAAALITFVTGVVVLVIRAVAKRIRLHPKHRPLRVGFGDDPADSVSRAGVE